jgi:drug/metabolite transporter (DMT)-like permease
LKGQLNITKGVWQMLIAGFCFAWMNACVKFVPHLPVFEIIIARALINLVMSYLTLRRKRIDPWGNNKLFLIGRGVFGGLGLICYFYTLQRMELANAIVIHYLSPIFTTLIALFLMGEKMKKLQWLAFAVCFTGVLMVKGFGSVDIWDFLAGVSGALFSGLAYNAIRNMKGKEHADVIVFYQPLFALPMALLFLFVFPVGFVMPDILDILVLLLMGTFTQVAQYFMTRAYQEDTAARISAVSYLGIVWGVLMGKFLFNDSYPVAVLAGIAVVLCGVLINLNAARIGDRLKGYISLISAGRL